MGSDLFDPPRQSPPAAPPPVRERKTITLVRGPCSHDLFGGAEALVVGVTVAIWCRRFATIVIGPADLHSLKVADLITGGQDMPLGAAAEPCAHVGEPFTGGPDVPPSRAFRRRSSSIGDHSPAIASVCRVRRRSAHVTVTAATRNATVFGTTRAMSDEAIP